MGVILTWKLWRRSGDMRLFGGHGSSRTAAGCSGGSVQGGGGARTPGLAEDVFYFVEQRTASFGGLVVHFQGAVELLHELALFFGEFRRRDHAHVVVEVAAAAAVWVGEALTFTTEDGAALRTFGNLEAFFAIEAGNLKFRAERGLGDAEWNRAVEIGTAAFEETVFLYVEDDVEITGGAAVRAGFAFALHAQACAGVHAGRDAEFNGSLAIDAALSAAIGATLLDDLSRALASGAGAIDGKEALLIDELAAAAAGLTGADTRSLLGAGAVAGFAKFLARHANLGVDAG